MGTEYERRKDKFDNVLFRVKKGKANEYRQAARDLGIGFWELIQSGVEEFIANHAGEEFTPRRLPESPPEKFTPEQRRFVEEFNQLSAETQKALVKLMRTINESKGGGGNGDD